MKKVTDVELSNTKNSSTLCTCAEGAYKLKKEIVLSVLKQSLLEKGIEEYEMVDRSLYEKYRCELSDCFENPGYLSDVLKYVYECAYTGFVKSIEAKLGVFTQEVEIKEFLEKLTRQEVA